MELLGRALGILVQRGIRVTQFHEIRSHISLGRISIRYCTQMKTCLEAEAYLTKCETQILERVCVRCEAYYD